MKKPNYNYQLIQEIMFSENEKYETLIAEFLTWKDAYKMFMILSDESSLSGKSYYVKNIEN